MPIIGFKKYNEISTAKIKIKKVEDIIDELCYYATIDINGEKIKGEIYTEKNGELECYQFYDKKGVDITEIYGQDILEKLIKEKLKKIR